MESKGDSNPSDAPKKDQTLIPTLPQDQESAGAADGTIKRLRDEIQALGRQKRELELRLDDARKKLHRAEADNRSLAAVASAPKDFETEADRPKRALNDLEADVASLATAGSANKAKIVGLEVPPFFPEELDSLFAEFRTQEQFQIMEARERDLQQAVKSLEEANTRREMELAEWRSQIDAAVAAARRRLSVSQVLAAVASVGAVAVAAVVVYLHHGNRR